MQPAEPSQGWQSSVAASGHCLQGVPSTAEPVAPGRGSPVFLICSDGFSACSELPFHIRRNLAAPLSSSFGAVIGASWPESRPFSVSGRRLLPR